MWARLLKLKLHEKLFYLLVFLLPTQLAFHFWPAWSSVIGIRVDYLAPAIYLTDILLGMMVGAWYFEEKIYRRKVKVTRVWFLVIAYVVVNIWGAGVWQVALTRWLKILELLAVFYYARVEGWVLFDKARKFLVYGAIWSVGLGVAQIINGGSLGGIFWWLGERSFYSNTPGIALMKIFGREMLRPYATFGHPNALAGYLLVTLIVARKRWQKGVMLLGLALTFSQNAWLALIVIVLATKVKVRVLSFKYLPIGLVVGSLIMLVLSHKILVANLVIHEPIEQRMELMVKAGQILAGSVFFGVGAGNFVVYLVNFGHGVYWWLQPVHNMFLLMLVEMGVFGFLGFYLFILKAVAGKARYVEGGIQSMLGVILFTGMFDHYWITLQQTSILFMIVLGLAYAKKNKHG